MGAGLCSGRAAATSQWLVGEPNATREVVPVLVLVVGGGLVEGLALGLAQSWALLQTHPAHRRRLYVALTVAIAGVGWSAVSLPASLSGASATGTQPPVIVVVLGGAGLGLAMGCVLGAVQAVALRGGAARPWTWVSANALAWVPARAVISLGATTTEAAWSWWQVLLVGGLTGTAAGACLGVVLGSRVGRLG